MIQNAELLYVKEQGKNPVEEVQVGSVIYASVGLYHQISKMKKKNIVGLRFD